MGLVKEHWSVGAMRRAREMVANGWRAPEDYVPPPIRTRTEKPSLVYFVQAGARGPIKIGATTDFDYRLKTLQTASPERLYVRHTMPGGLTEERAIHTKFAHRKKRGEWFSPAGDLLDYIDGLRRATVVA